MGKEGGWRGREGGERGKVEREGEWRGTVEGEGEHKSFRSRCLFAVQFAEARSRLMSEQKARMTAENKQTQVRTLHTHFLLPLQTPRFLQCRRHPIHIV